ncbi:hypothetical protein KHC23_22285 [Ancylobacter dichloromethanicus]|nr:hypothetical protein [Ancylobacter dichloromethanicus]
MMRFLRFALESGIRRRAVGVSVVVGTTLNIINQFDVVMGNAPLDVVKAVLTYAVPYCSATYGAVAYRLHHERQVRLLAVGRD